VPCVNVRARACLLQRVLNASERAGAHRLGVHVDTTLSRALATASCLLGRPPSPSCWSTGRGGGGLTGPLRCLQLQPPWTTAEYSSPSRLLVRVQAGLCVHEHEWYWTGGWCELD
jgi:hypothetical protein